ncbi:MAG TPA: TonB-dependent receptor [Myxococcales bacterium]|jgi:outer membrane cobalamin receptor
MSGRPPLSRLALAAGCTLAFASAPALAEDAKDLESLLDEAVVSSASRTAESASNAPATTLSLSAEEMRRYGIRSLDEAINFLAMGMMVEDKGNTVEVNSRGVLLTGDYGNHMLVLLDGHMLNEPWDGTAYFDRNLAIPWDLVDRVELVLGPGSVLYGSNAMLGVIHVVTKAAKDWPGAHVNLEGAWPMGGRASLGYGKSFTVGGHRGDVVAAIEYYGVTGPSLTYGPQDYGEDAVTGLPKQFGADGPATGIWGGRAVRSPYRRVPAAYVKASLGDFELSLRAAEAQYWTPFQWGIFDDPNGYERDRWLSLDAKWSRQLSTRLHLSLRAYGDLYGYDFLMNMAAPEDCLDGQTRGCSYRLYGNSTWGGLEAMLNVDWLGDGRLLTLVGVDSRVRRVASNDGYADAADPATLTGGTAYDHMEAALGPYLSVIARPLTWLSANAGARLDWDERFGVHVSPRASVTLSPWSGGALKVAYSEAFRAPAAYELYYADPKMQLVAEGLKAETVRSVEGSIEQQLGSHRLHLGVFAAWWSDLIATAVLTGEEVAAAVAAGKLDSPSEGAVITQYRNLAQVQNVGVEASVGGAVLDRRLRYEAALTFAQAREQLADGSEAPLAAAAQWFGNVRLSYDLGDPRPVVSLAVRFAGPRPAAESEFDPTPEAPPQVELRAAVTGRLGGMSYSLMASWSLARRGPYAVGPLRGPQEGYTTQELIPLNRFQAGLQLGYDL